MKSSRPAIPVLVLTVLLSLLSGLLVGATPAVAARQGVTNTAHLDFLLDTVRLPAVAGHTTYRLSSEPTAVMPWTYANAADGGGFTRVGGGDLDAKTGHYTQGAFNADDIARSAVVYVRHWQQFHDAASRQKAYELLRSVAYLQTDSGPNRGNVVLWIQSDGTLNRSARPVELPDPSDSGPSYWLARSLWAFGEGYAAFADVDPAFASFLQDRLRLGTDAVRRQVLTRYGTYTVSDGRRVPAWLIVNGTDVTAEASLGWSAYLTKAPKDKAVRTALRQSLDGVAAMGTSRRSWPYGAILPFAESRSIWHAWSSQMSVALARGATVLHRSRYLKPAIADTASWDAVTLTSTGPINAWYPAPVDQTQIAYGVDSRVQSLLAVAAAADRPGLKQLAALDAGWFFGANRAATPMYDPATGVTFDGLAPDGTVNHNSGAESTIHGLLTMMALDAHPAVRAEAQGLTTAPVLDGITTVEAETATSTTGTVVTPASTWTGESLWSGGKYLQLTQGERATVIIGGASQARILEPVGFLAERGTATSRWKLSGRPAATLKQRVGAQGISAVPGALLPQRLPRTLPKGAETARVTATRGTTQLDGVLVRPLVSRAEFGGAQGGVTLLTSAASTTRHPVVTGVTGYRSYSAAGKLVASRQGAGRTVPLAPGGFTVVTTGGS